MSRLRLALLAVLVLPGCDCRFDYGQPIDTKEIAKNAETIMAAVGVPLTDVHCGETFLYRSDHNKLTCKGTVEGLHIDVAVTFHDTTHLSVKPDLPELMTIKGDAFRKFFTESYGTGPTIVCPSDLIFWKGHDAQKCQLTVEDETREAIVRMTDGQGRLEADAERVVDVDRLERLVVRHLADIMKLEAKVDCGTTRLMVNRPGRRLECQFSFAGGAGRVLATWDPKTINLVLAQTTGLPHEGLEAELTAVGVGPAGSTWSCPPDQQIARGQPFTCSLVKAGEKPRPISIDVSEDEGSYRFIGL